MGRLRLVDREPLEGIAAADERLGRPMPLPSLPLPLGRWVEVVATEGGGVEVEWNLDDTRGGPGRLALWAGPVRAAGPRAARARVPSGATRTGTRRSMRPSPRCGPSTSSSGEAGELWLRLTAQGPWELDDLRAVAASIG